MKYTELNEHDRQLADSYKKILEASEIWGVRQDYRKAGISLCCNNPVGGILLTGINPSGSANIELNQNYYTFKDAKDVRGDFWKNKKSEIVDENDEFLMSHTAYLDLFPYCGSKQDKFMDDLKDAVQFQVKTLEITVKEIEEHIRPKLIIHCNALSKFYWGLDKKYTWMGYDMEPCDIFNSILEGKQIQIFRIKGFKKNVSDRILQDELLKSNLEGSYFIRYGQYNRYKNKNQNFILNPSITKAIYKLVTERIPTSK